MRMVDVSSKLHRFINECKLCALVQGKLPFIADFTTAEWYRCLNISNLRYFCRNQIKPEKGMTRKLAFYMSISFQNENAYKQKLQAIKITND